MNSVPIEGETNHSPPLVPGLANEQLLAWLATLLAAIQPTNVAQATPKRRRQPDPDMFDGIRKQYQVFY
jgi:hypothetical protein